jgi:hypothetical protein|tara:strand:- start:50 stop:382 length:333 start_codon:yes stop_codon:yes gene_type:complete
MSSISKVKQSIVLTSTGQLQKLKPSDGSAISITKAQIMTVYGMSSNTDAEIKIYNEVGSATAKNLIFHGKFGSAANAVQEFKLPGIGIYADVGAYVVLTNCDFCYVAGTF